MELAIKKEEGTLLIPEIWKKINFKVSPWEPQTFVYPSVTFCTPPQPISKMDRFDTFSQNFAYTYAYS